MKNPNKIFECRKEQIDYTSDQKKALLLVEAFLDSPDQFFLLSGNAGTGKTTICENIANYGNAAMLAPTNAAIKRLREKLPSFDSSSFRTLHAELYGIPDPETGEFGKPGGFQSNRLFIIDEASMIDTTILEDIFNVVSRKPKVKIIFLGDDFQLEPVGKDPKLFEWEKSYPEKFREHWRFKMTTVMRNVGAVLTAATHIRNARHVEVPKLNEQDFQLVNMFSEKLPNDIDSQNDFVVIVSTNKSRIQYNRHIRNRKFEEDAVNPICDGEVLISVSNQKFVNGEIYTVRKPRIIEEYELEINTGSRMYPNINIYKMFLVKHLLDNGDDCTTLLIPDLDKPSLYSGQVMSNSEVFYNENLTKYVRALGKRIWRPNVNIATYGYAVSAHKSQGQEWDNVYIDCDWLSDAWNKSRWLYTAVTRAKKSVELKRSNQFIVR